MNVSSEFYRQMAAHYLAADESMRVADAIAHFCVYGVYFGFVPESVPKRLEGFDARASYWWIIAAIAEYADRHGIVSNQQVANIMHVHRNTVWIASKMGQVRGWFKKIKSSSKGTTFEPIDTDELPDFIRLTVREIFDMKPDSPELKAAQQNPFMIEWSSDYVSVPTVRKRL